MKTRNDFTERRLRTALAQIESRVELYSAQAKWANKQRMSAAASVFFERWTRAENERQRVISRLRDDFRSGA